ncbi:hypothetical protein HW542_15450 [Asaia spathodeae]|uniref:Replication protein C n=2 Tax=Asaia spathodeae TaxID=657016 RepID=A0ABX2PA16_9PROT
MPHALLSAMLTERDAPALPSISKTRILCALDGVSGILGISLAAAQTLIDLVRLIHKDVWATGQRPIIAPSNDHLASTAQRNIRSIQRRIKELVEHGLVIPWDSSDGKRLGRRDGYGFDLSPLVRKIAEIEALKAAERARYREGLALRSQISAARRKCLALTDLLASQGYADAEYLEAEIKAIASARNRHETDSSILLPIVAKLEAKWSELLNISAASHAVDMTPEDDTNDAQQRTESRTLVSIETTKSDCNAAPTTEDKKRNSSAKTISVVGDFPLTPIMATRIAPAFSLFNAKDNWQSLIDSAPAVAGALGIGKWAWLRGCTDIGALNALAVLIVVCGRFDQGSVQNPGGLFVRLLDLHCAGKLRLDRTFFALLRKVENLSPVED